MHKSEALRIRANIETGMQLLSDKEALNTVRLFPLWKPDITYSVNYRIQYNNILYRCLIEHKSQEEWNPSVSPSLWTEVLIPDEDIIPEWKQPESTNPYLAEDKVIHNGKIWVSIIDNNSWEPGVFGWEEVN